MISINISNGGHRVGPYLPWTIVAMKFSVSNTHLPYAIQRALLSVLYIGDQDSVYQILRVTYEPRYQDTLVQSTV